MLKGYLDEQKCFSIADFTKVQSKLSGYICRQQIELGDKANKNISAQVGKSFIFMQTHNKFRKYILKEHVILVGNKKSAIL